MSTPPHTISREEWDALDVSGKVKYLEALVAIFQRLMEYYPPDSSGFAAACCSRNATDDWAQELKREAGL